MKNEARKNISAKTALNFSSLSAYEELFVLNALAQEMDHCIHRLKVHRFLRAETARFYRLLLNEMRAYVSQDVTERLSQLEIKRSARFSNERFLVEKKIMSAK